MRINKGTYYKYSSIKYNERAPISKCLDIFKQMGGIGWIDDNFTSIELAVNPILNGNLHQLAIKFKNSSIELVVGLSYLDTYAVACNEEFTYNIPADELSHIIGEYL